MFVLICKFPGFITLESVAGSAELPPLTIGHYYVSGSTFSSNLTFPQIWCNFSSVLILTGLCLILSAADLIICEQSNTNQVFQEQHYQSLARADLVVKVDPEEKTRPDSGLEEEKDLKKKYLKEENLQREEEYLSREEKEDLRRTSR